MQDFFGQIRDLFFIRSKTGRRLLFFMILISIVPLLSMGFVALIFLNASHRYDVASAETQVIKQKQEEIHNFIQEVVGIFQIRLNLPIRQLVVLSENGSCQVSVNKEPINNLCYLVEKKDLDIILNGILDINKAVESVEFIDISGKVVASSSRYERDNLGGEIISADVSNIPFFKEVVSGKDYLGPVNYSLSGPMITVATPLKNVDGITTGIVVGEVNLKQVEQIMRRTFLGNNGYAFLVDKNGRLISSSMAGMARVGTDLSRVSRIQNILAGGRQRGLEEEDRFISFWGKEVIAASDRIPELGWGVFVEWPVEDAEAIVATIQAQIINFTLVSLLAIFIVVSLLVARLIKPIRDLEKGATEIEKGNFKYRVVIKTNDELEDLGGAFNRMAKGLKRLEELKSEFVFVATHELRTPVTAIKGYLSMIFEEGFAQNPELKKYLEPVKKASDGLGRLVDDLLEVARSEAGRLKVEVSPQNIAAIIEDVLEQIKPMAGGKKVALIYRKEGEVPAVMANADKLNEVITNLVSNAVKYNKESGKLIIEHRIEGENLITSVQDTGIGISEEDKKKLFTKFFRAQETEKIKGTGLGLFISKELVERMGGEIWVDSEPGKGTTFSFSLRVAK